MSNLDEAIRQVALDYLKPPFKFNRGYIFDAEGHMVADDGDWKNHVVRIRGWGAISYLESPEQLQDMIGTLVAEALTEFWQRDTYRELCVELMGALQSVAQWDNFPPTGKFFESGAEMSFEFCYGSNGARDHMREVARAAISKAEQILGVKL